MITLKRLLRRAVREAYSRALQALSHVDRSLRYDTNLEWLFLLTMPNSGSTALAKVLMTAQAAVALTPRCEGEWLVPSLSNLRRRWLQEHSPPMSRIRARWMARLRKTADGQRRLVVEKSPSNMVRIDRLRVAMAPMTTYTMILVRDPYAVCESWHRRYGMSSLAKSSMPELRGVNDEREYFRSLGERWVRHATILANQRSKSVCVVRYEDFVGDPQAVLDEIAAHIPALADATPHNLLKVKDYGPQRLRDMNDQQIKALTDTQIAAISSGLERGIDVVRSFGYALRPHHPAEGADVAIVAADGHKSEGGS
jgi:hypothetical protein